MIHAAHDPNRNAPRSDQLLRLSLWLDMGSDVPNVVARDFEALKPPADSV